MPETNAAQQAQEAFNTLYGRVHVPAFFQKLASYGIEPQNEQEAAALLDMGQELFARHAHQIEKQAGARTSFILQAADDLGLACREYDRRAGLDKTAESRVVEAYADQLTADQSIKQAAQVYLAAQAQASA